MTLSEQIEKSKEEFKRKFKKYQRPTAISTFDALLQVSEFEDFMAKSQIALLKEVVELIRKKRQEVWKFYHEAQLWEEQKEAVKPLDDLTTTINELINKE